MHQLILKKLKKMIFFLQLKEKKRWKFICKEAFKKGASLAIVIIQKKLNKKLK